MSIDKRDLLSVQDKMSDNIAPNAADAMIDAVLAGLPKVDGDNDVEMTCPAAIPATGARDADLGK